MTSKLVVNTIEADTGISSVSFASSISMNSTSKFHFSNAGIDIGADTNINRPASGVLAFNINSSEKVRILSDGRVGVGTNNPHSSYRFDIRHSADNILHLGQGAATLAGMANDSWNAISFQGTNCEFGLYKDGSGNFSYIMGTYQGGTAIPIIFRTGNRQERLRIDSSGRVLMGTTTEGSSSADDLTIATTGTTGITLRSGTGSAGNIEFSDGTSGTDEYRGIVQYHHSDNSMRFFTDAERRVTIDSSGRIGLGANNNDSYDSNARTVLIASSGNTGITVRSGGSSNYGMIHFADGTSGSAQQRAGRILYEHSSDSLVFYTADTYALKVDGSGRVLIGTSDEGWTGYDELTIATSGNTGMTIRSGTSSSGQIAFADGTSGDAEYRGIIRYGHSTDDFFFCTNGDTPRMKVASDIIETGTKTITGGNNLAIQGFAVKGVYSGSSSIGKSIELISGYDSSVKMAAVGYNLTDVNLGSTYGGDLTFHTQPLYSSPTTPLPERMRISSAGYVTKPDTPAFIVRHSAAENYSAGSYVDGPWTVTLNRGSHFNTSNGIFTAPVAGLYQLNMMMNNDYNSTTTPGNFKIHVNNSLYAGMQFDPLDSHNRWFTHVLTGTLNLSRNDTVRLYSGGASRVDNYNWNHWSMYLVG